MPEQNSATEAIERGLAEVVGAEFVAVAGASDAVSGVPARCLVAPGNAADVARAVAFANEHGFAVAPRGGGTKCGWGAPPARVDVVLSTRRLNSVREHAHSDMTATVEAGCSVAEFQRALGVHGQRLALDPLWPDRATIGGVISANDAGPLRTRYGSLRNLILGVTVALPDGTLARSGGKVVKNVAGYDLPKLLTGSLGTLGIVTEATFRLHPLPRAAQDVTAAFSSISAAKRALFAIVDSTLRPACLQVRAGRGDGIALDARFEGTEEAVDAQVGSLEQITSVVRWHASDSGVWRATEALWEPSGTALICRFGVLASCIDAFVETVNGAASIDALDWRATIQSDGAGTIRLDAEPSVLATTLADLRAVATPGHVVVLECPAAIKNRLDVWGADSDAVPLMRRIKDHFDPRRTLNPGRFVGGI